MSSTDVAQQLQNTDCWKCCVNVKQRKTALKLKNDEKSDKKLSYHRDSEVITPFKVIDFDASWKPTFDLLVNNTNLHPISHCFIVTTQ